MEDRIYRSFLEDQYTQGMELARSSDLLELAPAHGAPPSVYVARFRSRGYLQTPEGDVVEGDHFEVGIRIPPSYLRWVPPFEILTWLGPPNVFHPNIRPPFCCIGRIVPGMSLVDILYQLFEVIGWVNVTVDEHDALDHAACEWARAHPDRYPLERMPLKRRAIRAATHPVVEGP